MEESEFSEAANNMADLISEYQNNNEQTKNVTTVREGKIYWSNKTILFFLGGFSKKKKKVWNFPQLGI